ncbi:hypothetical protein EZV62_014913 [Acer yangbiense]|uniref:Phosphofructokinase domain-containing protein n=1 Tax=Acer yangbiense TaxID=1000413 RepID=A0A5C7HTU2_9ROSI|nr:hypothetical protein EZV62_014913 [Acer yangbiense]
MDFPQVMDLWYNRVGVGKFPQGSNSASFIKQAESDLINNVKGPEETMHAESDLMFTFGGDGTLRQRFSRKLEGVASKSQWLEFLRPSIMHCSISHAMFNFCSVIDKSFGFGTVVEEAQRAINAAHDEAESFDNCMVLSRFIATYATLASRDVDCCLIPESPFYLEGLGGHMVIVIAEGAGQDLLTECMCTMDQQDASGNNLPQDVDLWISQKIKMALFPWKVSYREKSSAYYKSLMLEDVVREDHIHHDTEDREDREDAMEEGVASIPQSKTGTRMTGSRNSNEPASKKRFFHGGVVETPKSKFITSVPYTIPELYTSIAQLVTQQMKESEERMKSWISKEIGKIAPERKEKDLDEGRASSHKAVDDTVEDIISPLHNFSDGEKFEKDLDKEVVEEVENVVEKAEVVKADDKE